MRTGQKIVFTCLIALLAGCQSSKPVDDAAITENVRAKLRVAFGPLEARQVAQFDRGADKQTVTNISVTSIHGVVTLTGEVGGPRAKTRAAEIAGSVDHVSKVTNNLAVAPGYSDDAVGEQH